MRHTLASLFSGAGGLDMGFAQAGAEIVFANDKDKDACATHELWSGVPASNLDVAELDPADIPDAEIIAGGFPCQGFSLSGPRRLDDSRNTLYRHFVAAVKAKRPRAFVAENVKGLLTMGGGAVFEAVVRDFADCGYRVRHRLLNAADYGVAQTRERVIIIGLREDITAEFKWPEPDTSRPALRDALAGVPEPEEGDVCEAPYSSRYMSRNRKRGWDEPSFTIPAMAKQVPLWPGSPDMVKVEKDRWRFGEGKTRRLSTAEAAAIQGFPPGMVFCGNQTSVYRQIGNAVPVELARRVAEALIKTLEEDQ